MLCKRLRESIGEAQPQRFTVEPPGHLATLASTLGIFHTVPYSAWILETLEIVGTRDIHFSVAGGGQIGRATRTPGLEREGGSVTGL